MISRRSAIGAAVLPFAASSARGQPARYPIPNVTLVTHSSPGGGSDVFLRELTRHLQPVLGATFAIENLRGGSGAQAVARVARARPDGSMFYATTPTYIQTSLLSKPEYGYESLDPLAIVFLDPEVLYTRAASPFRTLGDALAQARANPGKQRWGAANPASLERIALERLNRLTGARAAVVSHEGGGDLMVNVLNGTLEMGIGEVQELSAQLEAGRVRLLGTLTEQRLPELPDVPTLREQGVELTVTKFRGLAGPKGVPDELAAQWEAALRQVLAAPAYKAVYTRESLIPVMLGRQDARRFTAEFATQVEASLRELGVLR